jgi:RNA-directed DNA polymerase
MKTKHPPWFKQSKIIHFDRNRPFKNVLEYVSNPENIAKHAFYPFIRFNLIKKIYGRDEHGKPFRLEEPKKREISYASHLDSNIFSFYAEKLTDKYENLLKNENCGKSVIAYRKDLGKSNVDFARDAFLKVKEVCEVNQRGRVAVICYDIKDFYGSLDHKILKEKLCEVLQTDNPTQLLKDYFNIYKAMTKFSWVEKERLLRMLGINRKWLAAASCFCKNPREFREKVRDNKLIEKNEKDYGIPQGSSISPVFSNRPLAKV